MQKSLEGEEEIIHYTLNIEPNRVFEYESFKLKGLFQLYASTSVNQILH